MMFATGSRDEGVRIWVAPQQEQQPKPAEASPLSTPTNRMARLAATYPIVRRAFHERGKAANSQAPGALM